MTVLEEILNNIIGRVFKRNYLKGFSYIIPYKFSGQYVRCISYYPKTKNFSTYSFAYLERLSKFKKLQPNEEKEAFLFLKKEFQIFKTKRALRDNDFDERISSYLREIFDKIM